MTNDNVIASCELNINAEKKADTHPDLRGNIIISDHKYAAAMWTRETQDQSRIYHSLTVQEPYEKGVSRAAPILKAAKLYEHEKREESDPDYQSKPVEMLGRSCCFAMWVGQAKSELTFTLRILKAPYKEPPSTAVIETLARVKERLAQRSREAAEEKARLARRAAPGETPDEIPMNELGEPTDVPF